MDAVEAANSGHPGMPMGMAPAAYLLYTRFMRHNPRDPQWPDRDRFVLSAGHGSMLLYSALHLSGYELPIEQLKNFRQWDSMTPGHPEFDRVNQTPGVEATTGPLGQGLGMAVGMALAERFLREHFGEQAMDHRIFGICSDGDLQEGLSHEAASLAGHLGLGRLVFLYDDNSVQLDGPTAESFSEDVPKRFEAYGWHTLGVDDVNDLEQLSSAIEAAIAETARPTMISVKSIIGFPAPHKQNTFKAHGSPLGEEEVRETKEVLGWDPDAQFLVPDGVYEHFSQVERGAAAQAEWQERFSGWRDDNSELAEQWDAAWSDPPQPMPGIESALPSFDPAEDEAMATRAAGGKVMAAFSALTPTMVGGAADLAGSTKTDFPDESAYTKEAAGRNMKFGVREHAMGVGRQRHGPSRGDLQALWRHVSHLLRLHAPGDPPLGADGAADRLGLHPRLHRPRRGRSHPPADRALRRPAGDPRSDRDSPRRCQRDRGRLGGGARSRGARCACSSVARTSRSSVATTLLIRPRA